jgi:integrase
MTSHRIRVHSADTHHTGQRESHGLMISQWREQMNNDIGNFLDSHPYAETTKRTYTHILSLLIELDTASLTASDLIQFISRPEWDNSRRQVALAASRKFIGWKHGQTHPALGAKLKRITGRPQRALTPDQALTLLASFDPHSPSGARDLAIASLALDTGLRCAELCHLQQADVDTERNVLQVIVKGGQWSAAVFSPETSAHIEKWKAFRRELSPAPTLFIRLRTGKSLTPSELNRIVRTWGKHIDIPLSPHDLRRSMATIATMNGAPERVLMEGGRWSNSAMIHRYTRTLKLEAMRQYLVVSHLTK